MEEFDMLMAIMEEYPELFYDTNELDGLDNAGGNDCVTQKHLKNGKHG